MTDPNPASPDAAPGQPSGDEAAVRRTIVVGPPRRDDDEAATPLVSTGDLGSASRSCLAIIVVLLFIALLLCVFLTVQTFR